MSFPDDVPTLTDGELTLRAHRPEDVDDVLVQCADPESIKWTTVPVPYPREEALKYLTEVVPSGWRDRKDLGFAIEAPHEDGVRRFSGSISLRPFEAGVAEIAFGLHPGARGRGLCGRAVKLILDWGFTQPDIDLVVWYAHPGNFPSWRVAWANGFSYDGKVAKFLVQRGVRLDTWCGSLRADDSREPKHPWHVAPTVESSRLRLRPFTREDGTRFREMMEDDRNRHFAGRSATRAIATTPEAAAIRIQEANAKGERFDWTIADLASDRFLGHIQLFDLTGLDATAAEIGYGMHPDARGKGVMTETLGMLVTTAFAPKDEGGLGLRRLHLSTALSNTASRYAAEKAGFAHIATHPDAFPSGESGFEDETIYALVNPHWTE